MDYGKLKMIELYYEYGFRFPMVAIYHQPKNTIPFVTDFKDGEIIEFWWNCEKPSAMAIGNAFYINKNANVQLINIKDIEEYKND